MHQQTQKRATCPAVWGCVLSLIVGASAACGDNAGGEKKATTPETPAAHTDAATEKPAVAPAPTPAPTDAATAGEKPATPANTTDGGATSLTLPTIDSAAGTANGENTGSGLPLGKQAEGVYGRWKVTGFAVLGKGQVLSDAEAQKRVGKIVEFTEAQASFDGKNCKKPGYKSEEYDSSAQTYLAAAIKKCVADGSAIKSPLVGVTVDCKNTNNLPFIYTMLTPTVLLGSLNGVEFCLQKQ